MCKCYASLSEGVEEHSLNTEEGDDETTNMVLEISLLLKPVLEMLASQVSCSAFMRRHAAAPRSETDDSADYAAPTVFKHAGLKREAQRTPGDGGDAASL